MGDWEYGDVSHDYIQLIAVALENYFPIPCKVSYPYAYFVWECMCMGTRLCKEWENNFSNATAIHCKAELQPS